MDLIGTTTKTIKTYGKKSNERVINISTWNCEVGEKLEEYVNITGNIPAKKNSLKKGTTSKLQTIIPQRSTNVTSKNTEKKPVEHYTETKQRKAFTKGFTKSKHYLSPIQPLQSVVNHISETSHVRDLEDVSLRDTPSPIRSLNKTRKPLTPKQLGKKYHPRTKNHGESIGKIIMTPLKDLINCEKENVNISHDDIETDSRSQNFKKAEKHLEIDKLVKEHKHTDELTELLNICDQKQLLTFEEFLGTE
jgi:hypothetical protein